MLRRLLLNAQACALFILTASSTARTSIWRGWRISGTLRDSERGIEWTFPFSATPFLTEIGSTSCTCGHSDVSGTFNAKVGESRRALSAQGIIKYSSLFAVFIKVLLYIASAAILQKSNLSKSLTMSTVTEKNLSFPFGPIGAKTAYWSAAEAKHGVRLLPDGCNVHSPSQRLESTGDAENAFRVFCGAYNLPQSIFLEDPVLIFDRDW